jgi:hypothetical protein
VNEEDLNIISISKFLNKTKKSIFQNYIKNYVKKNYKFFNENFTLEDNDKIIYFCINNYKIFEINYLRQIKINNRKEWICNSYYGLYLLYYVNKFEKPYPIINSNDNNIIQKTINNDNYFNFLISNDILSFENKQYDLDLNELIDDSQYHWDFDTMKESKFKKFLNIQKVNNNCVENYEFIKYLFQESNLARYNYIFGNKDNICNKTIIKLFHKYYYQYGYRYLYLDFDYIQNMKSNIEFKLYFAFWLIKSFLPDNTDDYENAYKKILPLISLDRIVKLLEKIIEINENLYNTKGRGYLLIILNNVNAEKYHTIIDLCKEKFNKKENFKFFIFCDIDESDNTNLFFNLYKENEFQLSDDDNLFFDFKNNNKIFNYNSLYYLQNTKSKEKICIIDIKILFPNDNTIECFCDLIIFLKKYMIYINFICKINESDKKTKISGIKFKNEEIKTEFLKKYKNYSFHLLNNENNIKIILRDNEDGFFFEKAIILDILTEKNDFN